MIAFEAIAEPLRTRLAAVRLMIFDIDGVMTDGRLYYTDAGESMKVFNVLDGLGIKLLQRAGIAVAILSGRDSKMVTRRAEDLGIDIVLQGIKHKRPAFDALLARLGLDAASVGFMGDDVVDVPVLRVTGFAAAVAGSAEYVTRHAHWVSTHEGGNGAVREVCELILAAQHRIADVMPELEP